MSPRILLVDDDTALLEALPEALGLRMEGIDVETSDSAREALALIADHDYDAIVTDIKMPGMDGLALLDEIGRLRPTTPTLLITGHGEHDLAVQALRGGAYDFIQKPIEREYFVASLSRAIEKRRLDRQVERQRQALERHARVLEHVGDGVFLVGPGGVIHLWNRAAEVLTGLTADSVVGRRPEEVLTGWELVAPAVRVAGAAELGSQGARTFPLEIGGRELWLSISGVEFDAGTVYAFRDLTGQRAVDELKDDLVVTISHELRTPLAAIYGAAETLRRPDHELDAETRAQVLEVISDESARLARVANDILLVSHIDSGRFKLADTHVDPADVARSVIETMQAHAHDGIVIDLVAPSSLPALSTDSDKLRQVLTNLIENAIKFSPEGGRVEVSIEAESTRLQFSVRDQGLGIPSEEQRRIFEKFYRVDPNLTRGIGGTGLGLYVCQELVTRMNGRIWVESEHGGGSTFFVDLPVAEPGRAAQAPSASRAS